MARHRHQKVSKDSFKSSESTHVDILRALAIPAGTQKILARAHSSCAAPLWGPDNPCAGLGGSSVYLYLVLTITACKSSEFPPFTTTALPHSLSTGAL